MRRLEGRVALVTGGGAGVGRATSLRFASEGAKVLIGDIDLDGAHAVVEQIVELGGEAKAIEGDAAGLADCERMVAAAVDGFGSLGILVNNAGLPSRYNQGTKHEIWDLGIEQSLSSVYRMSETAMPHLIKSGHGAIVNVCSIAGTKMGMPVAWYASAKAGVTGLTRSLAGTYGPKGVRANAMCLGLTRTGRVRSLWDNPKYHDEYVAHVPLGRVGEPEEAASVAAFLASDDAAYVTGEILTVDGGWSLL